MPVIFNEPLSFLQRLTEYMEHTYLIHKASSLADPVERMQVCVKQALERFKVSQDFCASSPSVLSAHTHTQRHRIHIKSIVRLGDVTET